MAIPYLFNPLGTSWQQVKTICQYGGDGVAHRHTLQPGWYEIICVGGGGGQGGYATAGGGAFGSGGGGSGSGYRAYIKVNVATTFEVFAGKVGATNRGYVGTGKDGQDSYIMEVNPPKRYIACRSKGTGSGGWNTFGKGGYNQFNGDFVNFYVTKVLLNSGGHNGSGGSVLGGFGTGGASVFAGWGKGAGPKDNGKGGFVKIIALK